MITYVTALFDINREQWGDGRSIENYLSWMRQTCAMNVPMVIFTQPDLVDRIQRFREVQKQGTKIVPQTLAEIPYAAYRHRTLEIINSKEYQAKVMAPERVECKLADYSLVIHSKFDWLKQVTKDNPFATDYFAWCDAGLSRFFPEDFDLDNPLDNEQVFNLVEGGRCLIQTRSDIHRLSSFEELGHDTINFLTATLFFGEPNALWKLSVAVKKAFEEELLARNIVNNEQISLAFVARKHPEWFSAIQNDSGEHLIMLRALQSNALSS